MKLRAYFALTCLGIATAVWALVAALLPLDTFDKTPEPARSATPAVTIGEWGSTSSFPHFTIMLQAPTDASSRYGCPDGPCPIIEVPALIVARDLPLDPNMIGLWAVNDNHDRLGVSGLGAEVLPAGATHATVLQIWTTSQRLKSLLVIHVEVDGSTVEWRQANRL